MKFLVIQQKMIGDVLVSSMLCEQIKKNIPNATVHYMIHNVNHIVNYMEDIMKSITIHGLDNHLAKMIKIKAEDEALSLNKTIKKLLEESLGIKPKDELNHAEDFTEFCELWNQKDVEEFNRSTADLNKIDMEDWR